MRREGSGTAASLGQTLEETNRELARLAQRAEAGLFDSIFLADLRQAKEVRLDAWRKRGAWERVKEVGATLLSRVL